MENKKSSWKKKAALAYGLFLLLGTATGLHQVNKQMREADRTKAASAASAESEKGRANYSEIEGMGAANSAGSGEELAGTDRSNDFVLEPGREILGKGGVNNPNSNYGQPSGIKSSPGMPNGMTAETRDSGARNGRDSGVEQIVRKGEDGQDYIKITGREKVTEKGPDYVQVFTPSRDARSRYFRIFTNAYGEITGTEQGRGYFDKDGRLVLGTREASCYSFVRGESDIESGELKAKEQFYPMMAAVHGNGRTARVASSYDANSELIKEFTKEREKELRKVKEGFENGK